MITPPVSRAARPKQVTVTHPGASKPKPTTSRKPKMHADLDVEKEFHKCREQGTRRLDLTRSSITTLPTSIKDLTHLHELYLYQNKLVKVVVAHWSLVP